MQQNYNQVPNIITSKDLDYLSDMFEWNYAALKKSNDAINKVSNEEIRGILMESQNAFNENLALILEILKEASNE